MEDFAKDEAIRVVVLKGAGDKAFVSGADISQFGAQRRNAAEVAASNRLTDAARQALATFPKPTIAMIQGFCLGGGLAIALMCDLRFASEDSTFGIPAARLGVGYAAQSVGMLQALVGPAYTREILFTGRRFNGDEALRMGLINRLLPGAELAPYVQDYAAMIGANAPLTIRAAKLASTELLKPRPNVTSLWSNAQSRRVSIVPIIMRVVPLSWRNALQPLPDADSGAGGASYMQRGACNWPAGSACTRDTRAERWRDAD